MDGGRAFPEFHLDYGVTTVHGGMSLRDYFAAAALPTTLDLARVGPRENGESFEGMIARKVYRIADAMIAERERSGG